MECAQSITGFLTSPNDTQNDTGLNADVTRQKLIKSDVSVIMELLFRVHSKDEARFHNNNTNTPSMETWMETWNLLWR